MIFLRYIIYFFIINFVFFSTRLSKGQNSKLEYDINGQVTNTITVDQSGSGNFVTVQKAIDSIESNNKKWTLVRIKSGVYNEKVTIPRDKPFIILEGESRSNTVIQWGDAGSSIESSTISLMAENFIAKDITFKNTYNKMLVRSTNERPVKWAPATLVNGDKSSFHNCGFISLQDTLTDSNGRHFYKSCYIEGAVDFIWGNGQSIYQSCTINVTNTNGNAYITAQARQTPQEKTGFVFKECVVTGTGPAYLGRAYGKSSRVIYIKSVFHDIIVPQGWSEWHYKGSDGLIIYAESGCTGPGANMSKRVEWEETLTHQDLEMFSNPNLFLDKEGWLKNQPISL